MLCGHPVFRRGAAGGWGPGAGQFEGMRREVADFSGVVEQVDYGADVVLSCLLPEERAAEFAAHVLDVTAGGVEVLEAGERFQDVPWRAAKEV